MMWLFVKGLYLPISSLPGLYFPCGSVTAIRMSGGPRACLMSGKSHGAVELVIVSINSSLVGYSSAG